MKDAYMKQLLSIVVLSATALTTACSSFAPDSGKPVAIVLPAASDAPQANIPPDRVSVRDEAGSVVVQKIEFRPGVSSASVERLARRFGCTGRMGAGLVTEKGPLEVYRMQCDNGTTFLAQCELRQCRPMR